MVSNKKPTFYDSSSRRFTQKIERFVCSLLLAQMKQKFHCKGETSKKPATRGTQNSQPDGLRARIDLHFRTCVKVVILMRPRPLTLLFTCSTPDILDTHFCTCSSRLQDSNLLLQNSVATVHCMTGIGRKSSVQCDYLISVHKSALPKLHKFTHHKLHLNV
ncbi:hypothetical protein KC19_3G141800, partial [Ceratodon purpureus]